MPTITVEVEVAKVYCDDCCFHTERFGVDVCFLFDKNLRKSKYTHDSDGKKYEFIYMRPKPCTACIKAMETKCEK